MTDTRPQHFLEDKPIIIAGAGISGLAFAISLHKIWPSISSSPVPRLVLYERDSCAIPPNREGFSLSLRSDRPSAGIQTLQKMGMLDRLLDVAIAGLGRNEDSEGGVHGKEEGGFVIWDHNWKEVVKVRSRTPKECPVAGMRIARGNLRRTLVLAVEGLPGVEIRWGNAVTSITSTSCGRVEVSTSTGEKVIADILIAADGSSSKIRAVLRPDDGLTFAGPTCIYGTAPLSHAPSDRGAEFGTIISGKGPALFIAPVDSESMVWCLSWHVPTPHTPHKQPMSTSEAEKLLEEAKDIGEPAYGHRFLQILAETDRGSVNKFNAMDKQSFAHGEGYVTAEGEGLAKLGRLEGKVVFLGDANHAVSPFAGNGANLALMDGWDFAESLVLCGGLEEAVRRYDRLAVQRARQVVKMSHWSIRIMHAEGWYLWVWMLVLRVVRVLFFK